MRFENALTFLNSFKVVCMLHPLSHFLYFVACMTDRPKIMCYAYYSGTSEKWMLWGNGLCPL